MSTFLFPGQGSQVKGMGKAVFEKFVNLTTIADDILGYSIVQLCLEDPQQQLNQTAFTQPALYVVNALSYYHAIETSSPSPRFVAGHSLGEYNALLAAKVFDFATGLQLVQKRGELMSKVQGGRMAAVVGLTADAVQQMLQDNNLIDVTIANYNSYTQLVITGREDDVSRALPLFDKAGALLTVMLNVSGAFHSPFMRTAQIEFQNFLNQFTFLPPAIPVIANVTAQPYSVTEMHQNIAQQISSSVRWTETIAYLLAQGVHEFVEIGPGQVLTRLVKRIKNGQ